MVDSYYISFAIQLRKARDMRNLSQSELAKLCDLHPSHVAHFESGSRKPSLDIFRKIVVATRLPANYFLGL